MVLDLQQFRGEAMLAVLAEERNEENSDGEVDATFRDLQDSGKSVQDAFFADASRICRGLQKMADHLRDQIEAASDAAQLGSKLLPTAFYVVSFALSTMSVAEAVQSSSEELWSNLPARPLLAQTSIQQSVESLLGSLRRCCLDLQPVELLLHRGLELADGLALHVQLVALYAEGLERRGVVHGQRPEWTGCSPRWHGAT